MAPRASRLSRSLKITRTDTDRSATYDFLLVFHTLVMICMCTLRCSSLVLLYMVMFLMTSLVVLSFPYQRVNRLMLLTLEITVVLLYGLLFTKKIFDLIMLSRFCDHLHSSELQFGFKAHRSTDMCTMVLKETTAYYINNGSPVLLQLLRCILGL